MTTQLADPEASGAHAAPSPPAIVVGAGPAGLACAATLKRAGIAMLVFEQADSVASTWRGHYDRLHLHTDRGHSGLPGLAMPKTYPRYSSRRQVLAYLEDYAAHFGINPTFGTRVKRIERSSLDEPQSSLGRLSFICFRARRATA